MSRHDNAAPDSSSRCTSPSRPLDPPSFIAHLTPDDKFIDIGYPLYESVAPGTNRVVAPVAFELPRYIRTTPLSGTTLEAFIELAHDPHCVGAVFHSLPQHWLPILDKLPSSTSVLWRGWGYEYYGTIYATNHYHLLAPLFPHGLLLPRTRRLLAAHHAVNARRNGGLVARAHRAARTAIEGILGRNRLVHAKQRLRTIARGHLSAEYTALQRIDFFAPVVGEEYLAAKHLHPWMTARPASFPYDVAGNVVDAQKLNATHPEPRREAILVGNSATLECNHLDVFALLSESDRFDAFQIIAPLSYGLDWYRDFVIAEGRRLFGDRFKPLVDFMPVVEYHRLLHSCSHAVMAHLRQQAGANVLSLIAAGTKIAMHPLSLLYQHYRSRGFYVYTIDDICRHPNSFATPLESSFRQKNAALLANSQSPSQAVHETIQAMVSLHRERVARIDAHCL